MALDVTDAVFDRLIMGRASGFGAFLGLCALAACSKSSVPMNGDAGEPDAAILVDASEDATVDAASDVGPPDAGPPCGGTGETYYFIFNELRLGLPSPAGTRPGVNLDGIVSDASDPAGCMHEDLISTPPDNEPGLDNEGGPALDNLNFLIDIDDSIASAFASGDALLVFELGAVDNFENDECVLGRTWKVVVPEGETLEVEGGMIATGQTFDFESALGDFDEGEIVDSRIFIGPTDTRLEFNAGGFGVTFNLSNAHIRFTVDASGATPLLSEGIVAGQLDVAQLNGLINLAGALFGFDASIFTNMVLDAADLVPNAEGQCQGLSAGFVAGAVEAFRNEI